MNEKNFIYQLNQLQDADWQAVLEGLAVLILDDAHLEIGNSHSINVIIDAPKQRLLDAATLKRESLAKASTILSNYYLTHPLTLSGFNHQVARLIERYGATVFTALIGQLPERTLFVEGGEVIAETTDSPRHRYGVFCELTHQLADLAIEAHIHKWLERGEAHESYLSMNVCRYSC